MARATTSDKLERELKKLEERYGSNNVRQKILTSEATFPASAKTAIPEAKVLQPPPPEIEAAIRDDRPEDIPELSADPTPLNPEIQRGIFAEYRRRYF